MYDIILFLKNNWQTIVAVVLFVLSFILQLLKKKPVKVVDSIRSAINEFAPAFIVMAEKHCKNKEDKLNYCLTELFSYLNNVGLGGYGDLLKMYKDYAIEVIERILLTPQKKNEN